MQDDESEEMAKGKRMGGEQQRYLKTLHATLHAHEAWPFDCSDMREKEKISFQSKRVTMMSIT